MFENIYKELIENSQDRKEVVEKDWIDKAFDSAYQLKENNTYEGEMRDKFREAIEKHCPPLQKKFTKEEISDWFYDNYP